MTCSWSINRNLFSSIVCSSHKLLWHTFCSFDSNLIDHVAQSFRLDSALCFCCGSDFLCRWRRIPISSCVARTPREYLPRCQRQPTLCHEWETIHLQTFETRNAELVWRRLYGKQIPKKQDLSTEGDHSGEFGSFQTGKNIVSRYVWALWILLRHWKPKVRTRRKTSKVQLRSQTIQKGAEEAVQDGCENHRQ